MITSATRPLLLEVGCEEIPARFLSEAQMDFGDRVKAALEETRLITQELSALSLGERVARERGTGEGVRQDKSPVQTYSTPRRLAAYVPAILERQADKVEEVTGPPIKVAVDATGKYTRAAESFALKNSATVADLTRITTPKGEYLAVKKTTPGRTASEVLSEILPGVITGLGFPKSMYWTGKSGPRFVRPIRWIIALLGEGNNARVVPFEVAGVNSANFTFGHRTMGREPLAVSGFKDYLQKLHQSKVELEPQKRREWLQLGLHYLPGAKNLEVLTEVTRVFRAPVEGTDPEQRLEALRARVKALPEVSEMRVVEDKGLEEWVVNSTEWPRALLGTFEERFLKLPREILVTVMRDHQKYFAVEDVNGNLRPHFVASLNREGDPQGLIQRGHERVLTARFSDAEFFWNADQKIPLQDRIPMLDRVTFQLNLGSYRKKIERMRKLAEKLCLELVADHVLEQQEFVAAIRAVELCKCDLTTKMVQEFPELQGVVGGLYARGELVLVGQAIYDHYRPEGLDDHCPRNLVGAVVSLVDKLDNVVGGFAEGLKPSGSGDPFGMRRQANGVIKLLLESFPPILFGSLLSMAKDQFGITELHPDMEIRDFFLERLTFYLEKQVRPDTVRAVLTHHDLDGINGPAQVLRCAIVLEKFRSSEDFIAMAAAAKRVRNILAKTGSFGQPGSGSLNEALLEAGPEKDLHAKYIEAYGKLATGGPFWIGGTYDYEQVFSYIASFRPQVDRFFDQVRVMADDLATRVNRLTLLHLLDREVFSRFVHLAEIGSVQAEDNSENPKGAVHLERPNDI